MIVGYIRVSTLLQKDSADTQRYEVLKLADAKHLSVDDWVIETVSGKKAASERKLGPLLDRLKKGDTLICAEISRIGRSLMDIMLTLKILMEKGVFLFTCKEKFELADNISSKVLAFAFGLAAEIERQLISARTREALARKKSEGVILGRPKGRQSASRLDGKDDQIRQMLEKRVSKASIAKLLSVHPGTLDAYLITRKIQLPEKEPAA